MMHGQKNIKLLE